MSRVSPCLRPVDSWEGLQQTQRRPEFSTKRSKDEQFASDMNPYRLDPRVCPVFALFLTIFSLFFCQSLLFRKKKNNYLEKSNISLCLFFFKDLAHIYLVTKATSTVLLLDR